MMMSMVIGDVDVDEEEQEDEEATLFTELCVRMWCWWWEP